MITSRSGTEAYHGFASDYYSYEGLNAKGEFAAANVPLAPYHINDFSFGVGGPIIPHHSFFFFVGFEPYRALTTNATSLQSYEDPAFTTFASATRPNSPEVQLLTKFPTALTFVNVQQTASQAFGPQNLANNTGCGTPSTDNIPCATPVIDQGVFNSSSYNNSKQYGRSYRQVLQERPCLWPLLPGYHQHRWTLGTPRVRHDKQLLHLLIAGKRDTHLLSARSERGARRLQPHRGISALLRQLRCAGGKRHGSGCWLRIGFCSGRLHPTQLPLARCADLQSRISFGARWL